MMEPIRDICVGCIKPVYEYQPYKTIQVGTMPRVNRIIHEECAELAELNTTTRTKGVWEP
jgi:hypothetical protein